MSQKRETLMIRSTMLAAAALYGLAGAAAHADTLKFHATMDAASEVPPKKSDGKGMVDCTIDTSTKMLSYTMSYTGLTGPATMAHFHGPADVGVNAGVMVPITPATTPTKGTATLTDAQIADFKSGKVYANVHTEANKGGEIRGQVKVQ
jgi:hypothetical protein